MPTPRMRNAAVNFIGYISRGPPATQREPSTRGIIALHGSVSTIRAASSTASFSRKSSRVLIIAISFDCASHVHALLREVFAEATQRIRSSIEKLKKQYDKGKGRRRGEGYVYFSESRLSNKSHPP